MDSSLYRDVIIILIANLAINTGTLLVLLFKRNGSGQMPVEFWQRKFDESISKGLNPTNRALSHILKRLKVDLPFIEVDES